MIDYDNSFIEYYRYEILRDIKENWLKVDDDPKFELNQQNVEISSENYELPDSKIINLGI